MKRLISVGLALGMLLCPVTSMAAHGSISFDASVDAGRDIAIEAPLTASIDEVCVKAGDYVSAGQTLAVMRSTKVYASESGMVSAIFGDVGYDATAATNRYSAVLFIEPTNKYTIYVDDKYAYENVEAMYPHLGDTVYLKCVTDGSHVGTGRFTAIEDDGTYTVETTAGEFYPGEAVRVYNRQRKYDVDRIGRGTIIPSANAGITGTGYIVAMHVAVGDTVEKGQLLFETADGLSGYDEYAGLEIKAPEAGIITEVAVSAGESVSSHAVVARLCPIDNMRAKMSLTEEDLAEVKVGDEMELVFEQIPSEMRVNGKVTSILYIPQSVLEKEDEESSDKTSAAGSASGSGKTSASAPSSNSGSGSDSSSDSSSSSSSSDSGTATDDTVYYSAYIDFPAVPELRLGMTATVYTLK